MKLLSARFLSIVLPLALWCLFTDAVRAAGPLSDASWKEVSVVANDVVYDPTRNVFYLSVPGSAGFPYGNSVVTVKADSAEIVASTFVGSEPTKLAISGDGSRVYIGLDGAPGFGWWEPATDHVSGPFSLSRDLDMERGYVRDLAVTPADPHMLVVVPAGGPGYLSDYDLRGVEAFKDGRSLFTTSRQSVGTVRFIDDTTLLGVSNYVLQFTESGLEMTAHPGTAYLDAGFQYANGYVFTARGLVLSLTNFAVLGTLYGIPYPGRLAPTPDGGAVFAFGQVRRLPDGKAQQQLVVIDRRTFLLTDTCTHTNAPFADRYVTDDAKVRAFVLANHASYPGDRLAYVRADGRAGIISIPAFVFRLTAFEYDGATVRLGWTSEVGKRYRVQWSTDLANWTTFLTVLASEHTTTRTFAPPGGTGGDESYRVVPE